MAEIGSIYYAVSNFDPRFQDYIKIRSGDTYKLLSIENKRLWSIENTKYPYNKGLVNGPLSYLSLLPDDDYDEYDDDDTDDSDTDKIDYASEYNELVSHNSLLFAILNIWIRLNIEITNNKKHTIPKDVFVIITAYMRNTIGAWNDNKSNAYQIINKYSYSIARLLPQNKTKKYGKQHGIMLQHYLPTNKTTIFTVCFVDYLYPDKYPLSAYTIGICLNLQNKHKMYAIRDNSYHCFVQKNQAIGTRDSVRNKERMKIVYKPYPKENGWIHFYNAYGFEIVSMELNKSSIHNQWYPFIKYRSLPNCTVECYLEVI